MFFVHLLYLLYCRNGRKKKPVSESRPWPFQQVLVCAPSNIAVDQLAEKLHKTGLKAGISTDLREVSDGNLEINLYQFLIPLLTFDKSFLRLRQHFIFFLIFFNCISAFIFSFPQKVVRLSAKSREAVASSVDFLTLLGPQGMHHPFAVCLIFALGFLSGSGNS